MHQQTRNIILLRSAFVVASAAMASSLPAAQLLVSDGALGDRFGYSVDISGTTGLIGAYWDDDKGQQSGTGYVFQNLDIAAGPINESMKLLASDGSVTDQMGFSVSLSQTTGIIGALGDDGARGAAYVFRNLDALSGTISQSVKLISSERTSNSYFGWAVTISGNSALVGAYWILNPTAPQAGSAYYYRNLDTASGTVTENVRLISSDYVAKDCFGYEMSLDGDMAVVGARGDESSRGSAYVFRNLETANGVVTENAKLVPSDGQAIDGFGASVSLSSGTALIGSPVRDGGSAYLFHHLSTATGTITENLKLRSSDGAKNDGFGVAVSLSGSNALIGAPSDDDGVKDASGSAYLFLNLPESADGIVTETVKITASASTPSALFGNAVSMDADNFIIGAWDNAGGNGRAYSGSVSSLTTLDAGATLRAIDGISLSSRTDWIIGDTTDSNRLILTSDDLANVTAVGKAVYIGKSVGSDTNHLVIEGTLETNRVYIGYQGSGALTVEDSGKVTVGGGTGTVRLGDVATAHGVLNIGTGGAAGSLSADTIEGGTGGGLVKFNHNGSLSFSPRISGNLALQQVAGITTLTGLNTFEAGTEVSGGTLKAGNGTAFTQNTSYTVNGGTLDLNGYNLTASSLSGTGGSINLGTASLTIDQDENRIFSGSITGTGALTKTGGGILTLEGNHSFTGGSSITGGSLLVNGHLSGSDMYVGSGGILGGVGSLGKRLLNAGTVSPGQSVGTLSIGGNFSQTSAGTLAVEINNWSGQHDRLTISGGADLAGNVVFLPEAGLTFQVGDRAEFLTATGGISGEFDNFSFPTGTILQAKVIYESNAALIELEQGSFADFATLSGNPIWDSVASLLDEVTTDIREQNLIDYLNGLQLGELSAALGDIAPEELSAIHRTTLSTADSQARLVQHRSSEIRRQRADLPSNTAPSSTKGGLEKDAIPPTSGANRWNSFVYADVSFSDVGHSGITHGYESENDTVSVGLDYAINRNLTSGLLFAYTGSDTEWHHSGDFDMDGGSANLFASFRSGAWYLDTMVGASVNDIDYSRDSLLGKARGSTDSTAFNAYLGGGYEMSFKDVRFGPIWSLHYTQTNYDSFKEKGSLSPLEIKGNDLESLRGTLGVEVSTAKHAGGIVWVPQLNVAWLHEFGDVSAPTEFRFASGAGSFQQIENLEIGRDALLVGASLNMIWTDQLSTFIGYNTQLARANYRSQHFSTGLTFSF